MKQIRFDDLDALRAQVSDEFGPWGAEVKFDQDRINQFADLTGDHQWIHVDVDRAASGPFGATIAHGLLTLAMLPAYRAPSRYEIVGAGSVINYGFERVRFLTPIRAGSAVRARSRLSEVREHARGTLILPEVQLALADSDQLALAITAMALYTA